MIEAALNIFVKGFEFVYTMLTTVKLDGISIWSYLIVFILGAGVIRALMNIFNPAGSGSMAAGAAHKLENKNSSNHSKR